MKRVKEDAGKGDDDPIPVSCPCCKNKRLFDFVPETTGKINIKCQRCGNVIKVEFNKRKVRTEQIGV